MERKRRYRDLALIEEAARLYIQEGYTLAQVSAELGVPERTVQEWSRKFEWVKRRKRYLLQNEELEALIHKLALRLVKAALEENPDPQLLYALTRAYTAVKPSAQERLRELEKLEKEGAEKSAEERMKALLEFLRSYGMEVQNEKGASGNPGSKNSGNKEA